MMMAKIDRGGRGGGGRVGRDIADSAAVTFTPPHLGTARSRGEVRRWRGPAAGSPVLSSLYLSWPGTCRDVPRVYTPILPQSTLNHLHSFEIIPMNKLFK